MSSLALSFNKVKFSPIVQCDGQIWLSAGELAQALDYKSAKSVSNLYNANKDEFTPSMSLVTQSVTNGINNSKRTLNVRIFSLRGCHLIAMFARTSVAKEFRKWVLDILDKEVSTVIKKEPFVTAEQKQMIKEAVNDRHHRTGEHWQTIYTKLHESIGVNSYHEIPMSRFNDAMAWLYDGYVKAPKQSPNFESHAHNTASHMLWVSRWWYCYRDAIRLLNPQMAGEIHGHFMDGSFSAGLTLGADRSKELDERIQRDYPYQLGQHDLIDFFRQR